MTDEHPDDLTRLACTTADDLLELLDERTEHLSGRDASAVQQAVAAQMFVSASTRRIEIDRRPVTLAGTLEQIHAAPWPTLVQAILERADPTPSSASAVGMRTVCVHRSADDGAPGGLIKVQAFGPGAPPGMQMLLCAHCLQSALASIKPLMVSRGAADVPPPNARH